MKGEELQEIEELKHLPIWCKKLKKIIEKYEKNNAF